jgi:diguanylate cyclase (GGDEF)-like protein/PAS domain S-box-containing protein
MPVAGPSDIAHWRAQIFNKLLQFVLPLAVITAVPSAALLAIEGKWPMVAVDLFAIAWLSTVWYARKASYHLRVYNFLLICGMVGVALLRQVGPISQIYLVAVPVLAALLLGLRPALWWLAGTGATVLLISATRGPEGPTLARSAIIAINFIFITGIMTMSCAVLLRHLANSMDALRATAFTLEQGRNELHLLNAELSLTSAAVAHLNDMVLIAKIEDGGQAITFVNDAFERRTGYRREEVLGRSLRLLAGAGTDPQTLARIERAVQRSEAVSAELLNYTRDGEAYWVETELVPFADEGGVNTHWVVVERDITERRQSEDDIHRLAFYDVLTGLPNRRLLMDRIDKLLASSLRDNQVSAVMFIDLDHFKNINDARGHAVGDALLRNAATRLSELTRKADTVARIGGDEFVVLLSHIGADSVRAAHSALGVAEKIRQAIADSFEIEGQEYHSSASIGVTLLPKLGQSADDLLREADTAMYRAKADGRNGIVFFEEAMQADVEQRLTMARDLACALDDGQLQMHYQPQVGRRGEVVGAELLMRWRRPDGGMVAPDVFIPIAEQSGLIQRLGHWALRQACDAVLALAADGHALALSVNVSPSQFRQDDFVDQVRRTLLETGAPARCLILEVTEGLLIEKFDETIERMHQLAALGLRFSIDDFGTGYSSLAYLRRMPLYELKIDRSFIHDIPGDANGKAIVQSILAMARHLGLRVVAEGVETAAQAAFLAANDCDCMQGYLFARPAPFSALLARLDAPSALPAA